MVNIGLCRTVSFACLPWWHRFLFVCKDMVMQFHQVSYWQFLHCPVPAVTLLCHDYSFKFHLRKKGFVFN